MGWSLGVSSVWYSGNIRQFITPLATIFHVVTATQQQQQQQPQTSNNIKFSNNDPKIFTVEISLEADSHNQGKIQKIKAKS